MVNLRLALSRRDRKHEVDPPAEESRVEERRESLARAAQEWKSLLREMEHAGQSSEARYESYYRAYLQAREKEKRADLELFNIKQRLRA